MMKFFLAIFIFASTTLNAQETNQIPAKKPDSALISASASVPRLIGGGFSVLLQVSSLTGDYIPIAVDAERKGFDAFSAASGACPYYPSTQTSVPRLSLANMQLLQNADPKSFTAGVERRALVIVRYTCNTKSGDEVSFTARLYALSNGRWIPQEFSWERQIVK